MTWQITRDKFLSKQERDLLIKATEEKAIIDVAKGRKTWVRRWMLIDLALFSGLRVSDSDRHRAHHCHRLDLQSTVAELPGQIEMRELLPQG